VKKGDVTNNLDLRKSKRLQNKLGWVMHNDLRQKSKSLSPRPALLLSFVTTLVSRQLLRHRNALCATHLRNIIVHGNNQIWCKLICLSLMCFVRLQKNWMNI